ncbi:serine hydrolase domain-containing protein [Filimonas effusa]|nr:serine hydrolase domain-containing protein [Filimonas effusa]
MKYILFTILCLTACVCRSQEAQGTDTVSGMMPVADILVKQKMAALHIPGFEAAAIDGGKIIWTGYYGYQDLKMKKKVTDKTIFEAASVSKTLTAAAMMQLYADGRFKLEDDVNKYLDFKLVNPHFPLAAITFGQLLKHTSSIDDNADYLGQFWDANHGDPVIPLGTFIREYFSFQGKHYDQEKNFYNYPPGSKAAYSNMGIALLGYLAERITGTSFERYCKSKLFRPLEMNCTGWFLREIDSLTLAMPYSYSDSLKQNQPWGYGGFPDYPAGGLHTNVQELAHFLIAWTQQGKWGNVQVFDSKAIQTLTPDDFLPAFYTWSKYTTGHGAVLYMHTGKANGVSSFISYNPVDKKGLIFICNGDINTASDWKALIDGLYGNIFKE